jgi:polyphosphate kinase
MHHLATLRQDPDASGPQDALAPPLAEQFIEAGLHDLAIVARVLDWADDDAIAFPQRATLIGFSGRVLDQVCARMPAAREASSPDVLACALERLTGRQQHVHTRLVRSLAWAGVRVVRWPKLAPAEREVLGELFQRDIFPLLLPQTWDAAHPFPFVSSGSSNLAVAYRAGDAEPEDLARIEVPCGLATPRFVSLPATDGSGSIHVPLESLIEGHLGDLFPGAEVVACGVFRVIRSRGEALGGRTRVTRVEVSLGMAAPLREEISHQLRLPVQDFAEVTLTGIADWESLADSLPAR